MFHKNKGKKPPTPAEIRQRVRRRMTLRGVLAFFVVLTMIRAAFMHRFENIFVCVLALILLALPSIIEKQLAIDIPPLMEGIIYCFIYAAEILGEINSFTRSFPAGTPCCIQSTAFWSRRSASVWSICSTEASASPSVCRRFSWRLSRSAFP